MSRRTLPTLAARAAPLASPEAQRRALRGLRLEAEFEEQLSWSGLFPFRARAVEIFQVNVGKVCNQTCKHCHVDAGPDRRETMSRETMELCLAALARSTIPVVDITGGAPEMNPHFRWFVEQCRGLGRHVIDRCNLTILETPSHRDLPEFFAAHDVELACSLPHYTSGGADRQRGDGVFEASVRALRRLNALGYGTGRGERTLTLVTNPLGAYVPAAQGELEASWRRELMTRYGITFDRLFSITNMPISRYLEWLVNSGNLDEYMGALAAAFNPAAAASAMCRNTISVAHDGTLHDCDFNQMLAIGILGEAPKHIADFDLERLATRPIATDRHCFGCTAGSGSTS